jgi:hypothetical protein
MADPAWAKSVPILGKTAQSLVGASSSVPPHTWRRRDALN